MRIFIAVLILIFTLPTPSQANDIRDFQIEGMSIGDSLLDYFTKEKIENAYNYDDLPSDMKFRISGVIDYSKNINECYKKQLDIVKELSAIIADAEFKGPNKSIHTDDKSGKSTYTSFYSDFKSGESVGIQCYDWSNESKFYDNLRISLHTKETTNWIKSNYGVIGN